MVSAITSALTEVLGMVGSVVSAFVSETGDLKDLLPLLALGVAISITMFGVKVLKSFVWGA